MNNAEEFGRALRFIRLSLSMEQGELGERSGLSSSFISLLEAGLRNPSWESLCSLSEAMDLPLSVFFMVMERETQFVRPLIPFAYEELVRRYHESWG